MPRHHRYLSLALLLLTLSVPLCALDILITNDDGLTANARALHQALSAEGHQVLMVVPCRNQSGQGAALNFLKPIGPLAQDCVGGIAHVGDPGVGSDPGDASVHYVDGTPVMALLYGLDVRAHDRWGRQPRLVVSGPNEGNNTGLLNPSSGTVNNAVYAINRGIPALAVSADGNTANNPELAAETAQIVLQLVRELVRAASSTSGLLPAGTGLNVNVPKFAAGRAGALPFARTVVGTYTAAAPKFVANLAQDPFAAGLGITAPLPGITLSPMDPRTAELRSEARVLSQGKITVSVIEGNFGAGPAAATRAFARLHVLFQPRSR